MSLARILLVAALVTGCVPSHRAVFGPVDAEINRRLGLGATAGTDPKVRAAVAMLLTHPLDADAAVRIAIANNRELQARYDELGIAAADIATATVLDPTDVDFSHKVALSGDGTETEIDAIQNITGLLQIPQRRAIASAGLAAVRARAVAATIELVAHVETTFYDVVAATQTLELRETAFAAASAAAELTERMHVAGNTTDLQLARDLDQREQARVELGRAQLEVEVTREQLNEALGLYGPDTVWTAAPRLPELPASAPALDQLETEAIVANLELVAVRADADAAAGRVGYARLRTWLPEIGIGASVSRRDSGEWEVGPAVRIGLPIFNQQQGPRARANAELRRARNLGVATAIAIRARARAVRLRVLEAYAEARHLLTTVLPLRQEVVDETLKQYNAMNASTFELLIARRELVDGGQQYIDALHRYWTAQADATALARGGLPSGPEQRATSASTEEEP